MPSIHEYSERFFEPDVFKEFGLVHNLLPV